MHNGNKMSYAAHSQKILSWLLRITMGAQGSIRINWYHRHIAHSHETREAITQVQLALARLVASLRVDLANIPKEPAKKEKEKQS